jgi:ribosomal protein S18 acetylase RimI-like enzyme
VEIRELGPGEVLFAYELLRRRGDERMVEVYELGVAATHRRRGGAAALWRALSERLAGREAYVLVEETNARARALYAAMGLAEPDGRVLEYDGWLNDSGAGDVP